MSKSPMVMADIKAAAARLFATRDGAQVLDYLSTKYYDAPMKDATLTREAGRRDVLLHIKQLTRED